MGCRLATEQSADETEQTATLLCGLHFCLSGFEQFLCDGHLCGNAQCLPLLDREPRM